jgi:hypothetical protein
MATNMFCLSLGGSWVTHVDHYNDRLAYMGLHMWGISILWWGIAILLLGLTGMMCLFWGSPAKRAAHNFVCIATFLYIGIQIVAGAFLRGDWTVVGVYCLFLGLGNLFTLSQRANERPPA